MVDQSVVKQQSIELDMGWMKPRLIGQDESLQQRKA